MKHKRLFLLLVTLGACLNAAEPEIRPGTTTPINGQWKFYRSEAAGSENPGFDDSAWESAVLPHTAKVESLNTGAPEVPINEQWMGIFAQFKWKVQ